VIRPSPTDLQAAVGRAIPDVIAPGLQVLFVGINPGLYSGATGRHFARPGNRFWPTLHQSGFTPRQLAPDEPEELLALGIGISNIVNRTTATAAELSREELTAGAGRIRETAAAFRPTAIAILGVTAYRTAFERPDTAIGRQDQRIGDAETWVLPNPSGLNAHYQLPELVALFAGFRKAIGYTPGVLTKGLTK
jgi:TDG/mug DNA glycosylase family protein